MRDAYFVWGNSSALYLYWRSACSSLGLLKEGLVPTFFRTKSKGNMQSDSFDRYCAMKKYFYELCEHKAIDELAFKKFA